MDGDVHGRIGELACDEVTGEVQCHLCGRSFRALGSHIRVHDLTADAYREAFGLFATKALTSQELSETRRDRQQRLYRRSPATRSNLGTGQKLARSGELNTLTRRDSPQRRTSQLRELKDGRATRSRTTQERLRTALADAGFPDSAAGLRTLYVDRQTSMENLAALLGVSRVTLRNALLAADIPLRAIGVNTDTGRRSRIASNIARAAALVGTTDLHQWLHERRSQGASLQQLATELNRSVPWVKDRLSERSDHEGRARSSRPAVPPG
ncbi:MucR family transcriptional regulator [Herbidospora cretacea]|uniref:MucR family transcriptional regulator n=1 Tax=Herbidospora cretacea TaxID=28444 RepID=UPI000774B321|nr:MucR family transcriptional regulator [Herbidospora cretacea]